MEEDFEGFFGLHQLLLEEGLAPPIPTTSPNGNTVSETNQTVSKNFGNLTNEQRRQICFQLLGMKKDGKLPHGAISKVAREVGVHKSTISRIFQEVEKQSAQGEKIDVKSKKKGRSGRPSTEVTEEWLQSCPLHLRCTYRAYAGYLKCSHMQIFRLLKAGKLRVHTSNNHPAVTEKHKIDRMHWIMSHIDYQTECRKATFKDMSNTIHIDEKWFYLNPDKRRFYLLPSEVDPYRVCLSKRYKIKVMFLAAQGNVLFDENGVRVHDGKFGIFPFSFKQRAKKRSKNREAGTIETKAVQNVTKDVIRDMLLTNVIPSIKEKWPQGMCKDINIQQDNARPYLQNDDPLFREAATSDGFNINLINQPPQSPDFNVLDLAIFRAIQSLQYRSFPNNLDDLIDKVRVAYDSYDPNLIRYTWIQLQHVMVESLKVKGGNNYKMPHVGKARLERLGLLQELVEVDQDILDEAVAYLNEQHSENASSNMIDEEEMEVDAD